jgi:hypothetical protein
LTNFKTGAIVTPDRSHHGNDENQKPKRKMNTAKKITAGQILTSRSICDYDCIYQLEIVDRKKNFATVRLVHGARAVSDAKRVKVRQDETGNEYVMPERYSMAPIFRAA